MAMVDNGYSLLAAYIGGHAAPADLLGPKVSGHMAPFLYSSREPTELSQWLCYDDSIVNIVVAIIIMSLNNVQHDIKIKLLITIITALLFPN